MSCSDQYPCLSRTLKFRDQAFSGRYHTLINTLRIEAQGTAASSNANEARTTVASSNANEARATAASSNANEPDWVPVFSIHVRGVMR